jgi:formylglycine-generating enzyme required for sulfatase activity
MTLMIELPGAQITLRDEGTRREWPVELAPFRLDAYPVTRERYGAVTGVEPRSPGGAAAPVTEVSWIDAIRFCNLASLREGLEPCYTIGDDPDAVGVECDWTADGYRLPLEAEWEYACRAGSAAVRYGELDEIAWHRGNSGDRVHDAGGKEPNVWGFYDMIGNVWEWCWDVFDPKVYGPFRVFRGGGWFDLPRACRASCRRKTHPTLRIDDIGFRLARRS